MSPARDRSPPRRWSLGRFLNQGQWTILLVLYAAIIFAGLFSVDYRDTSPNHSLAAWLAIVIRVYAFHIGLVCAVVAALALVTLRLGRLFCTLPLMLFCLWEELGDYRNKPVPPAAGETITVMTYCLYPANPPDAAAVLSEVQQANPDVLLLQRFTNEWSGALHETLVRTMPYYQPIVRDDGLGTAIYSRRAFDYPDDDRAGAIALANKQVRQARAVIHIDGKPVAIYCLRLLPLLRSDWATANRVQFADLLEYLQKEKLPAIVAGDFNFTRRTKQGRHLRDELGYMDAYQWVGQGRGGTWPANHKATWLPLMQLDHVYLSQGLVCTECRTGQAAGSDHLPVIARIGFSTEGGGNKSATELVKTDERNRTELPKTDLTAAAKTSTPPRPRRP